MSNIVIVRSIGLAGLFVKEQLKEPAALFWILLSPGAVFYVLAYSKGVDFYLQNYSDATAWFYAYIALNVALFGFSFYIVGRRESGFVRSFIYTLQARYIFLLAQFLAYSGIAFMYCLIFYLMTRLPFGEYSFFEAFDVLMRFYCCFVIFCIPGLLLTLLPLNFQSANTLYSVASFVLLASGLAHAAIPEVLRDAIGMLNLLMLGKSVMQEGVSASAFTMGCILIVFALSMVLTCKKMLINPVWSRY